MIAGVDEDDARTGGMGPMAIKTELIWDGKYDSNGKKVAPLRVALPFQTIETVNESVQDRQRSLFQAASQAKPWRNRLIWGDKKYVLPSLLPEFAGKVNLVYIDPPFDTGADFSFTTEVPDSDAAIEKQPSMLAEGVPRHLGPGPLVVLAVVLRSDRSAPRTADRRRVDLRAHRGERLALREGRSRRGVRGEPVHQRDHLEAADRAQRHRAGLAAHGAHP